MYTGGAMFVDEASGFLHVKFQTLLNSHQTLKAKEAFEGWEGTMESSYQSTYRTTEAHS
jgi:hypothetical protein